MKCTQLVLKRKSGLKVYKIESVGRKMGAKACGGTLEVTESYGYDLYDYQGYCGSVRTSDFEGFDLKCRRCGTVVQHFGIDDLQQLVEKSIQEEK